MSDDIQEVQTDKSEWYKDISLYSLKQIIKDNIGIAGKSFVAIGYYLKNIRDRKLYQQDGYESIWEFAKEEFGIGKSSASQFMSINDRFSKDGNSPILLDQYKDFSSSKLAEMLTLTNEQLDKVTPTTTISKIREIKKPVTVLTSEQKIESENTLLRQETEISEQEKWLIRCGVLKKMCDSICYMGSYILEKNRYDMETIRSLSERPCSFGFGDDGTGHSIYDAVLKAGQYKVREFHGDGNWVFESGEVDQQIWNFNGREWYQNNPILETMNDRAEIVIEVPETETQGSVIDQEPEVTERGCDNCKYNIMPREDYFQDHPGTDEFPCDNCNIVNNWRSNTDIVMQEEIDSSLDQEPEILEADVIQTDPDNLDSEKYSIADVQWEIRTHTNNLDILRKDNTIAPTRYKTKMRLDAATALLDKLNEPTTEDENIVKKMVRYAMGWFDKGDYENADFYLFNARKDLADNYEYDRGSYLDFINDNRRPQPLLPVLKNNDQRKEWIDNYKTWPVWIDLPHTGEKYYRYDLSGKVAIVVKVSRKHSFAGYKEIKDYEYGAEQYYLMGVKSEWSQKGSKFVEDDSRTFYECNTNKSALVEYLKDFQKKG